MMPSMVRMLRSALAAMAESAARKASMMLMESRS
jgi:hypothetical protein